jgi:hypothetical protein
MRKTVRQGELRGAAFATAIFAAVDTGEIDAVRDVLNRYRGFVAEVTDPRTGEGLIAKTIGLGRLDMALLATKKGVLLREGDARELKTLREKVIGYLNEYVAVGHIDRSFDDMAALAARVDNIENILKNNTLNMSSLLLRSGMQKKGKRKIIPGSALV